MVMSQQYSLRWNNHQPNFISMFTSLLNTQTLVDVTLAADGRQLLAHKVVLSACSTYFQSLFVDNPSPHPIVILKDVTYADLRTMVDFMYCGEVNVTEEQLPKVLDTAKLLKIKGLTEMPETITRTQGPSAEVQGDSMDSQRHSPALSPSNRRKRVASRRKSSTGSTCVNTVESEPRAEVAPPVEAITLSSLPQQRRMREYHEIRTIDNSQQTQEQDNLNLDAEQVNLENQSIPQAVLALAGASAEASAEASRLRRAKHLKRQSRVADERLVKKQMSEPAPATTVDKATPTLQKHESYPAYTPKMSQVVVRKAREESSLVVRAVVPERQASAAASTSSSLDAPASPQTRASHTPAVRSGPPLSCNFCWNTVDECGRILRRKTQYHCPECRTNLCIVPCFHEYHDGPESEANNANTNAR